MKHVFTFWCLLLLLTQAKAQVPLIRKMPYAKTSCSLLRDSTVGLRVDNQYNTGRQLNCYEYYNYDKSGRITTLKSNCERGNYWYYYYSRNQTPYADSVVYTFGGITRISAYTYGTDSIITSEKIYYTDKGFPELGSDFRYTSQQNGHKLILTAKDIIYDTSLGEGYNRITFENEIEKLREKSSRSVKENYIVYTESFDTQNSDTILSYLFDSTVSKTNPQDIYSMVVKRDSFASVRSHYAGFDVIVSIKKASGFFYGNPQLLQEWKKIDTIYANGSSISYTSNLQSESYTPTSKVVVRKGGNELVSYQYTEKKWTPTRKEEHYFIDAEKKCEGLFFYYIWVNNQWVLDIQSAYYYQGQTANRPKQESVPCKIVNPFSANYPVSCDALLPEEKYVLSVLDLDGHSVLEQEFKVDQQVQGLDVLKKDRLYFFTILTDSGKVVTRQKVFISY